MLHPTPQPEQKLDVTAQVPLGGARRRGANDHAHALGHKRSDDGRQAVPLVFVQLLRDTDERREGHQHEEAPGQGDLGCDPGPLGAHWVLEHLDHQLLARLQKRLDIAPRRASHIIRYHDLVDVEERVLLQPDVNERRLHPREDVSDLAEVDVADHATLRTLDVQLNQATVLKDRHTGLVRIVRDEHLASDLSHGMSPLQGATPGFVLFDEEVDTGHAHPCVPTESGRDERFGPE